MTSLHSVLVVGLFVGCAHTPAESPTRPTPSATSSAAPSAPPSSSASTPVATTASSPPSSTASISLPSFPKVGPGPSGLHTCEPFVRCGVWSKCGWFEHLPGDRWRLSGQKDGVFVRRHQCGGSGCAVHCPSGKDCYDALHPVDEKCTEVAPLGPNATHCSLMDGVCGSLM
ncbi:MAG: hypothetical protein IPJ34_38445 [Myxococcales bacterium]|nr:hypothetical protein [Myxococcales bacterium]